jgi:hypothetical protein
MKFLPLKDNTLYEINKYGQVRNRFSGIILNPVKNTTINQFYLDKFKTIYNYNKYEINIYGEIRNKKSKYYLSPSVSERHPYYSLRLMNNNGIFKRNQSHILVAKTFLKKIKRKKTKINKKIIGEYTLIKKDKVMTELYNNENNTLIGSFKSLKKAIDHINTVLKQKLPLANDSIKRNIRKKGGEYVLNGFRFRRN